MPSTKPPKSVDIDIRRATSSDLPGLATSSAALFAEDGVARDRLRNAEWPQENTRPWIEGLLSTPDALVLVAASQDGKIVGQQRFHVSAYAANESAIRFYRRHGFTPLSVELVAEAMQDA